MSSRRTAAPGSEAATMTSMKERFLAELRELVDAWHAAELDFPTFTACKEDTWDAIRKAGPAVEAEVLRALRDQLPTNRRTAP